MKVLQVNNVYAQQSTGKLTRELHGGLLRCGQESLVVYGRGKTVNEPGVIRLCPDWYGKLNSFASRFAGIRYGGCLLSTLRLQRIILREKPDIVHLQCINGNFVNIFRLMEWLKKQKIKTVLTLHAEFMYTANCGHAFECDQWKQGCRQCPNLRKATKSLFFDRTGYCWNRMRKAFEGFDGNCVAVAVSPWTAARAGEGEILKGIPIHTIYNGVDTGVFSETGLERKKNTVFHATAKFSPDPEHPKGGWHLIRLAQRMPEVTFLVAGSAEPCGKLPENLVLLGEIRDQEELADHYRKAALTVLVSRKETFSMPCAESLCCGTPVVGFRAGAPEQIALPEYSEFVKFGDLDSLEAVLKYWLARTDLAPEQIARQADQTYSSETMIRKYLEIYRRLLWN